MTNQNQGFIDDMQAFIDFVRLHPDMGPMSRFQYFCVHCTDRAELLARTRGVGEVKKEAGEFDGNFNLRKNFGQVVVGWFTDRSQICERVVTGTKILPAEPEKIVPAKPERTIEIVEWICPKSLLAADVSESHTPPTGEPLHLAEIDAATA